MQTRAEYEKGFTIVELLLAGAILSIGILAWGKTLESSIRGRVISDSITTASELAMKEFEDTAARLYEGKIVDPPDNSYPKIIGGTEYLVTRDIKKDDIHLIIVNVSWNKYGNKSFSFERIVAGIKK